MSIVATSTISPQAIYWLRDSFSQETSRTRLVERNLVATNTRIQKLSTSRKCERWLSEAVTKLQEFRSLAEGWDSYNAPTPSGLAVGCAEAFLEALHLENVVPSRIAPSVIGGIGVTIRRQDRRAYVEFLNAGNAHVVFTEPHADMVTKPFSVEPRDLQRLAMEIRQFHEASAAQ